MTTAGDERLIGFVRSMRRGQTDAERTVWHLLRGRRFLAWKFRRQVPIGAYIADFVCFEARLVIEIDGGQHAESRSDERRDRWFASEGFDVLRLWNHEVLGSPSAAGDAVFAALSSSAARAPSSAPSGHLLPRGEKGEPAASTELKVAKSVPRTPSLLPSREKVAAQRPDEGARAAQNKGVAQRPDEGARAAQNKGAAQRPDEGARAAHSKRREEDLP